MTKLLIDIGNTNTAIALLQKKRIVKRYFISTSKKRLNAETFKRLLGQKRKMISEAVIVSVVPKFCALIKKTLKTVLPAVKIKVVGKDIQVPVKIKYKDPGQVGRDRLVAAYSAYHRKKKAVLVIDFGTAVTFDYINKKGEYEGGIIFPGIRLALKALSENAALLPKTDFTFIRGIIGRSTKESIKIGTFLGYISMCDGIIELFRSKFGKKVDIIATGGDACLIARKSEYIRKKDIHPDLIFDGLNRLSQ